MPDKGITPLIKEYRLLLRALEQYERHLDERSLLTREDQEQERIDGELQDVDLCRAMLRGGLQRDWGVDAEAE